MHEDAGYNVLLFFFFGSCFFFDYFLILQHFARAVKAARSGCYRISRYTLKTFHRFLRLFYFSIAPRQLTKRMSEKLIAHVGSLERYEKQIQ